MTYIEQESPDDPAAVAYWRGCRYARVLAERSVVRRRREASVPLVNGGLRGLLPNEGLSRTRCSRPVVAHRLSFCLTRARSSRMQQRAAVDHWQTGSVCMFAFCLAFYSAHKSKAMRLVALITLIFPMISSASAAEPPRSFKLRTNQIVHLRCEGQRGQHFWLKGIGDEGAVGLAAQTDGLPSTRWRVLIEGDIVFFACMEDPKVLRWLDGHTLDGKVALARTLTRNNSGIQWTMLPAEGGGFQLKCLGHRDGYRWLTANAKSQSVILSKGTETGAATIWTPVIVRGR